MSESLLGRASHGALPQGADGYYCVGSRDACDVFEEDGALGVRWSRRPEFGTAVRSLRLLPTLRNVGLTGGMLPHWVCGLTELRFLEVPLKYLIAAAPGDIPSSLESLMVSNSREMECEGTLRWEALATLPCLKSLSLVDEYGSHRSPAVFAADGAHALRLDFLSYDASMSGSLVQRMNPAHPPRDLVITRATNAELSADNIRRVRTLALISPAKSADLSTLSGLKDLQALHLNGVRAALDIAQLTKIPNLKELTIYNSKKLTNVDYLADSAYLERLTLVNCGAPFKGMGLRLRKEDYEHLDIAYA